MTAAFADTYSGRWIHAPGEVFADLVAAIDSDRGIREGAWLAEATSLVTPAAGRPGPGVGVLQRSPYTVQA